MMGFGGTLLTDLKCLIAMLLTLVLEGFNLKMNILLNVLRDIKEFCAMIVFETTLFSINELVKTDVEFVLHQWKMD